LRIKAEIRCEYSSAKEARSIAESLKPDNAKVPPKMKIRTRRLGKFVISEIEMDGSIETLLSTLDDMLACAGAAEDVLKNG